MSKVIDLNCAIEIKVRPEYLPSRSKVGEHLYSYTIDIHNRSEQSVQLIARHWLITNANEQVQEVQGIGVVGEQPHIAPGETYTYSSGVALATETGTMTGSYQMLAGSQPFDVEIPLFALVPPHALH